MFLEMETNLWVMIPVLVKVAQSLKMKQLLSFCSTFVALGETEASSNCLFLLVKISGCSNKFLSWIQVIFICVQKLNIFISPCPLFISKVKLKLLCFHFYRQVFPYMVGLYFPNDRGSYSNSKILH